MKKIFYLFLLAGGLAQAQDNQFSFELKGNVMIPAGDNFLKDGLKNFSGFGLGFQGFFYKGFGLGAEYNFTSSEVKNESVFGTLKAPSLSSWEAHLLYHFPLTKKWEGEGSFGLSALRLKSRSDYRSDGFKEHAGSVILGAKLFYALSEKPKVQVFASPKLYFYSSDTQIDQSDLQRYYSKATLINLSAGVRLNF